MKSIAHESTVYARESISSDLTFFIIFCASDGMRASRKLDLCLSVDGLSA